MQIKKTDLKRITDYLWELPEDFRSAMRVPARVYAREDMLDDILQDDSLEQLVHVAAMPGIQRYALVMPDVHEGYGMPIGGVAAFDAENGVISPGSVGFDINCGVRIMATPLLYKDIRMKLSEFASQLYREVPSGVGRGGRLKLSEKKLFDVLSRGVDALHEWGYATENDKEHCEARGRLDTAVSEYVSPRARKRGSGQLGTIGAGNHFVEVQRVDEIFDETRARRLGLSAGQVTIMVHCGSRGLGHQVATDHIRSSLRAMNKYDITVPDKQLACTPFTSEEGQQYWGAMSAAANFAWANRQFITWEIREAWNNTFGGGADKLELVYDVAHNLAKRERHSAHEKEKELIVHRKGATRAFPPGHSQNPARYRDIGQPVLIPGSMGTASYVLTASEKAMDEAFGSSCHGAGRVMSRSKAKREVRGDALKKKLEERGIIVRAGSMQGLAEEAPEAYKNIEEVIDVVHSAGIAHKVARVKPVAVIKG